MRYFTRGWTQGELGEEASEDVWRAYSDRLSMIASSLPAPALQLAREIDLHDAEIERVEWSETTRNLTLALVAPGGTEDRSVVIKYTGAMLGSGPVDTRWRMEVLRAVARDRETQILYDEVDCQEDGVLSHRLLFWPRDELTIDCTSLSVDVSIRPNSAFYLGGYFVEAD
jgi:hypothetical protein